MKLKLMKKIFRCAVVVTTIVFTVPLTNINAQILHETRAQHMVANGVTYELNRQVTTSGFLDVHVLRIDMTNDSLDLGPAIPREYGTRASTTNLLSASGAVAGINGDFFDMTLNPVTPMGQVISNGDIVSLNGGEAGYATFFVDQDNIPFIGYIRPQITFLNNGVRNITVQSINKFDRNFSSALFDRQTIYNTRGLDNRFEDLVKLVIEDDVITYISEAGETVDVPENGYIIVMSLRYASYFTESVRVGDTVELRVESGVENLNLNNINAAIGGAGTILENGALSNSGFVVAPNSRHPRSAIGINQDGSEVILVAVDGRSHSIGATHSEMANIMLGLGARNAMHLDGGGSTTIAAQTLNDDHVRTLNTLSDGVQRNIVNALGVFNNSVEGEIFSLIIDTYPAQVFRGGGINLYPFALDDHLNRMDINMEDATLVSDDENGVWQENTFFPSITGDINFTLTYQGLTHTISVESLELAAIIPATTSINVTQGSRVPLNFTGMSTVGHTATISGLNFEVIPSTLGRVENNVFIADSDGSGHIRVSVGEIHTYIGVNTLNRPSSITFNNPFNRDIQGLPIAGDFDITVVGHVVANESEEIEDYLEIQNEALQYFAQHSLRGIFAGRSDIEEIEGLHLNRWSAGYSSSRLNNVALINLDASRGSLMATSSDNWRFVNEVVNSTAEHIIIKMDRQISSITSAVERQVLREALESIADTGKNVFVVSTEGFNNSSTIMNGVTYINIGGLFRPDGTVNENFSVLRFRVTDSDIAFHIQNSF